MSDHNVVNYRKQNTGEMVAYNSPEGAAFTVGAEAAHAINVAIQLKDADGNELTGSGAVMAYLSDDADGSSVAGTAPDGHVAVGTDGLCMHMITDKLFELVSESDGDIDLTITNSGADAWYLVLVLANGKLAISGVLTFAG